ncbi:MAG TPA: hypothetical protein PK979_04130 [Bacteroidales bacterium]|nr:hypothetical protein [Bacteroidales bacterium]HPK30214.1 hypothetical protein [Bacteroidales bacterium]
MREDFTIPGLRPIGVSESACIIGGIDKKAQDALYYIGYVIGLVAQYICSLFKKIKNVFGGTNA